VVTLHLVVCRAPACGRVVTLCTVCNVPQRRYCGPACRAHARRACLREAGLRYQRSRQGRLRHARRQRRYTARLRARKKVTHQEGPSRAISCRVDSTTAQPEEGPVRCACCGRVGEVMA